MVSNRVLVRRDAKMGVTRVRESRDEDMRIRRVVMMTTTYIDLCHNSHIEPLSPSVAR